MQDVGNSIGDKGIKKLYFFVIFAGAMVVFARAKWDHIQMIKD